MSKTVVDINLSSVMETVVVSTPEELESGLKALRLSITRANKAGAKRVVGLGFFRMEDETICTDGLKLVTATFCLWVNLRSSWMMCSAPYAALQTFLQLPDTTFVGLGIDEFSLDALYATYGLRFWNVVDLASLAADVKGDKRIKAYGLLDLAWSVCKIRVKPMLLECYSNSAVFARITPNSYAGFTVWGQANSVIVDAYLAFLIGNCLLGGEVPYKIRRYNVYSEATDYFGVIAGFVESLCSPRHGNDPIVGDVVYDIGA